MNIETKLQEKFSQINNVFWEKENNKMFLRIELNMSKLADIEIISREISKFLDSQKIELENYFLDIYSKGTDKVIPFEELKNIKNDYIQVFLKEKVKENLEFIAKVLEFDEETITIQWNAKGQFRKANIKKENIKEIKTYAKV